MNFTQSLPTGIRRLHRALGALVWAAVAWIGLPAAAQSPKSVDCRYESPQLHEPDAVLSGGFLPTSDIFRPLLADPKEPRFSASLRRVTFEPGALSSQETGRGIWAGQVGFASSWGLYGWRSARSCDGVQVNISGGVFSQFNLDGRSVPLINSDFVVSLPVTFRSGGFSGRLRIFHQSSHLGDEFVLFNPQVERIDLGYEAAELILSLQDDWWRVYAGGAYIFGSTVRDFAAGKLQAGAEARVRAWRMRVLEEGRLDPVIGVDATSFAERDWGVTVIAKGGLSGSARHSTRHVRVMAVFLRGFVPFGQFFSDEQLTSYGLEAQFEY